ncbi:MAG: hypothetical protein IPO24_20755 [Bacteroidetes bacterium]|nr:hypothetical protein [Bacteroidota bacterium]
MADASEKKTKKIATARKISNAITHCTHLPLPAHAPANPKAKPKECNRQRFEKGNRIKIEIFFKTPLLILQFCKPWTSQKT